MDIQELTRFFLWCTIIDGALLAFWTTLFLIAPDLVYRTQSRWVSIPRETFSVVFYAFLGMFKILFLIFNLVPLFALLIIG